MICRLAYKVCSSELHVLYAVVVSKRAKKRPIHGASKRPHLNKVKKTVIKLLSRENLERIKSLKTFKNYYQIFSSYQKQKRNFNFAGRWAGTKTLLTEFGINHISKGCETL